MRHSQYCLAKWAIDAMRSSEKSNENVIEVIDLKNYLGEKWVHDGLNLTVKKGEIVAIIGASGCGKTTLLQCILMLRQQTSGTVKLFGVDTLHCSDSEKILLRQRLGVMFQSSALFSSLTVLQNVLYPLREYSGLPYSQQQEIARLKLAMVGLEMDAAIKFPSELSGGMKKRVAAARALALDPELLFLDEPTAGLDPKSAGELDELILHLRESLGITIVMVTHDLDTLWRVPDRVFYLGDGKVLAATNVQDMMKQSHPLIQAYFSGPRAKTRAELAKEA